MIILLIFILFHRIKLQNLKILNQSLKEKYQSYLMDYLFDETHTNDIIKKIKYDLSDLYRSTILVDEMRDLMVNLTGDSANKLRKLFYNLKLDADSKKKIYSKKWHIKIKGFREMSFMNIKSANEEIMRNLHHRNSIVRIEAQLAMVRLNDDEPFSFLDHLVRPLTLWEQVNIHEMIITHNLTICDFQKWLNSKNRTVVLFALRMIKVFDQKDNWENLLPLLESDDDEIRNMTIYVLGGFAIKETFPYLKHIYKKETYENCLAIIQAIRNTPNESAKNFLKLVIDKEDDVQLQIEATKAIYELGETGQKELDKLLTSDYKNYQIIIKHVLDKRI